MRIYDKIAKQDTDRKVITVAFLGDSVTQGCFEIYKTGENSIETVYSYKDAFSIRFREILNTLYPDMQVNIINAGASGDNSTSGLQRMDKDILAYRPDLVVISYGLNDAMAGQDGIAVYADNLRDMFRKAKQCECDVIYLTQNYMNTEVSKQLQDVYIVRLAESFASVQNGKRLKSYFESGKKVAEESGVMTCDGYAVWEKMESAGVKVTELLANKLNHPIKEYHTYIAIKLIEKILGIANI